ncbi:MAG: hypothetical protein WC481_06835 [Candidatus Omnitrophota bacterium]
MDGIDAGSFLLYMGSAWLFFFSPLLLPAIFLVLNLSFIDRKGIFFLAGTGICLVINIVGGGLIGYFVNEYYLAHKLDEHTDRIPYDFLLMLLEYIIPVVLAIIAMVVMTGKFRRGRQSKR